MKKQRKRRSKNKHGDKNFNLCDCGNAYCDSLHSMDNTGPAMIKIQKRLSLGLCMGCGKDPKKCSCKSKM